MAKQLMNYDLNVNLSFANAAQRKEIIELFNKVPNIETILVNILQHCARNELNLNELLENHYRYKEQEKLITIIKDYLNSSAFSEVLAMTLKKKIQDLTQPIPSASNERTMLVSASIAGTIEKPLKEEFCSTDKQEQVEVNEEKAESETQVIENKTEKAIEENIDEGELFEVKLPNSACSPAQRFKKLITLGLYQPKAQLRVFKDGRQELVEPLKQKHSKVKKEVQKNSSIPNFDEV